MTLKAFKYRFYPTPEQEKILAQTFGCVRYVFNKALEFRSTQYRKTGNGISYNDTSAALTTWKKDPETEWLKDVSCVPLQQTLRHLNTAFSNFFAKRSKYPRFKKRSNRQSAEYTRSAFKWESANRNLTISKLGRLRIRWSRQFDANPSTVTISKTPTGKYFVSIRIDEDNAVMPEASTEIGLDLGIKTLATSSNGEKVSNLKVTARYAKRLARAQRILSRRKKGSNRWHRARVRVAKIQEKIANTRLDWTHKATTKLIREHQAVFVEDLSVSNLSKNRRLAKSILDCSWFEFVRQLEYKADWYGREFAKIGRFEPTSKTCSGCGFKLDAMPLNIRQWECPGCGEQHDRDENAAKNILAAGRAVIGRGAEEDLKPVLSGRRRRRRSVKQLEVLHS